MVDNRQGYAGVLLLSLLLLCWTENSFFLAACILEFLFPVVLAVLLRLELGSLSARWDCPETCYTGQVVQTELFVECKAGVYASGVFRIRVRGCHVMFGETVTESFDMNLCGQGGHFVSRIPTDLCGKLTLGCEAIELFDLFGLCRVEMKRPPEKNVMVYPADVPVQLSLREALENGMEQVQETVDEKGKDNSEVFDLRSYQEGDDVRSIHWKLSAKMDSLLVREFCDAARYDTLLFVDPSLGSKAGTEKLRLASACIAFGYSVSRELIRQGIAHGIAFLSEARLFDFLVTDQKQFPDILDQWMSIRLPEQSGLGMKYLKLHECGLECRKLLYITTVSCPDEVEELSMEQDVTVVCLTEQGIRPDVRKQDYGYLLNLPVGWLNDHVCRLKI